MKTKDLLWRVVIAIVVATGTFIFTKYHNLVSDLFPNLLLYGFLLLVMGISFKKGYVNLGYGILFGLMATVLSFLLYFIIILFNRLSS